MRRLIRWTKYLAWTTFSLALLAVIILVLLLTTESGSRWLVATAVEQSEANVVVRDTHGTLWRGMQLGRIEYAGDAQTIAAEGAEIRIRWAALTLQSVALDSLEVAELQIEMKPKASAPPEPLAIEVPPLPVTVSFREVAVDKVVLSRETSETIFKDLNIQRGRWARNQLRCDACAFVAGPVRIRLSQLRSTLSGDVPFSADVHWSYQDSWAGNGSLHGTLAELAFLQTIAGEYSGSIDGTFRLVGRIDPDYEGTARFDVPVREKRLPVLAKFAGDLNGLQRLSATGQFDEFDLTADGALSWDPLLVFNGRAEARAGENFIAAIGGLQQHHVDARWEVDVVDAAQLQPDLFGAVSGAGQLTGPTANPVLTGRLNVSDLAADEWRMRRARVDLQRISKDEIALRLTLSETGRADSDYGDFVAKIDGSTEAVHYELDWSREAARSNLRGQLRRDSDRVSGTISAASVEEPTVGNWQLVSPLSFSWQDNFANVGAHSWTGGLGQVDVKELVWRSEQLSVRASADELPLAVANPFLPLDTELQGTAAAEIDARFEADEWRGDIRWQQRDSKLLVTNVYEEVDQIEIKRLDILATFDESGVMASADLDMPAGIRASLKATAASPAMDAPLEAQLTLAGESWDWVSALAPEIDNLDGQLTGTLQVGGTIGEPNYSGKVLFTNGSLTVPSLAVPLEDLNVNLVGATGNQLGIFATANAGGGVLEARGELRDVVSGQPKLSLSLEGVNAEVLNWPEYHIWASPDTELRWQDGHWTFSGSVGIPRARIDVREIPKEAIIPSPDAVVVGEISVPSREAAISGSTEIVFGEDVRVDVLGLRARLGGRLNLALRAERPPSASGRVSIIDGTFAAYGRELIVQDGVLTFTGPLDDPIVDVTAKRRIETLDGDVLAGIRLSGTATDLTTTLFSEPAMAEADALSYLLIGRPVSQATQSEGGELSNAAFGLGLNQASRITDQIGQAIGLDELSLVGENDDSATLIAGKRINSKLYARYTFGAFSHLGTLLLRYKLSRRLTIEAGTGESQSIDVLYSVEKD